MANSIRKDIRIVTIKVHRKGKEIKWEYSCCDEKGRLFGNGLHNEIYS